jgi:hypothetical protein
MYRLFLLNLWLLANLSLAQKPQISATVQFPIKVSENKRYFVDQTGKPFLFHADTGWLLFTKLTRAEAREYLIDRRNRGFTTILTQFSPNPDQTNRAGQKPFLSVNDFGQPNNDYFAHIEDVLRVADSLNLLVAAAPFWLGCSRDGYGMPGQLFEQNGPEKARQLGEYLGRRFRTVNNLVWIMGGDNDPGSDRAVIDALAIGLHLTAHRQLITYHAAPTHSSTDVFAPSTNWLAFSTVHAYWRGKTGLWLAPDQVPEVYEACLREYNRSDRMPFVLGQAQYEGYETEDKTTPDLPRRQAWWAMLSGAAGHAYGTPIHAFTTDWRKHNSLPGLASMNHLTALMTSIPWWRLIPDQWHRVVVENHGNFGSRDWVSAAVLDDGSLALAYLPTARPLTVDLAQLSGSGVEIRWMNPRTGESVSKGKLPRTRQKIAPPGPGDWVLMLRADSFRDWIAARPASK